MTRNFTEKAEAETRKKIDAEAEAFATEGRTRLKSLTILITKKVRMERLQWGFPIATALSLTCSNENDPSNAVDGLEDDVDG